MLLSAKRLRSRSMPTPDATPITAALLVIGDEILSGRTKDVNIGTVADYCTDLGIELQEVRVVPDIEADIVAAVNALRARYTYVFTTGGIGPTHDDITADAIAKAFGVALPINAEGAAKCWRRAGARPARWSTRRGSGWRAFRKGPASSSIPSARRARLPH